MEFNLQKIEGKKSLTICQNAERREYRTIELKDEPVQPEVVEQVEYYINWASQNSGRHLDGAFDWNIQPVIVAPIHNPKNWQSVVNAFRNYNQRKISLPILYFEFEVDCGSSITFKQIDY
ncbi:MAG: hypothetical protein ACUVXI_16525 [bacterium]